VSRPCSAPAGLGLAGRRHGCCPPGPAAAGAGPAACLPSLHGHGPALDHTGRLQPSFFKFGDCPHLAAAASPSSSRPEAAQAPRWLPSPCPRLHGQVKLKQISQPMAPQCPVAAAQLPDSSFRLNGPENSNVDLACSTCPKKMSNQEKLNNAFQSAPVGSLHSLRPPQQGLLFAMPLQPHPRLPGTKIWAKTPPQATLTPFTPAVSLILPFRLPPTGSKHSPRPPQ
jgi:hypothetical protein